MRVYGVDFTSRPTRTKSITCAECTLEGQTLVFSGLVGFSAFNQFEEWLLHPGPWVAGMDFPFGQSRRFIENIGWPYSWQKYVRLVKAMTRSEFRQKLDDYRAPREPGDKEHRRSGDHTTGAISPQKLYGVPVGLMFYEGAQRLLASGVHIPGLIDGDPNRCVVEAYPGVLARKANKLGYKSDTKAKQSNAHAQVRKDIVRYIQSPQCLGVYGVNIVFDCPLEDDPTGDTLDAVLCALQAAWAFNNLSDIEQKLTADHRLEGWIADPVSFL